MSGTDGGSGGINRARVVAAALELMRELGLEAVTMRALADRLGVKAASLYWHVRDRDELLEMLAAALMAEARAAGRAGGWRADALAVCAALERVVERTPEAARVLLGRPDVLRQSQLQARLVRALSEGGLSTADAAQASTMMMAAVLVDGLGAKEAAPAATASPVQVAIDTGSRGVTLRAGTGMTGLIRAVADPQASAPAVIRGDRVIVRRVRGGRHGELELNPGHAWRFRVQAPTWNTLLDLAGLDVREIHVDSGAARVECALPPPRGIVPVDISSGVVGVRLRRAPGARVVAHVSTGAVQLRLDGRAVAATATDLRWESEPGAAAEDHYALRISSGAVRVSLEEDPSIPATVPEPPPAPGRSDVRAALELVLDGVADRATRRTAS